MLKVSELLLLFTLIEQSFHLCIAYHYVDFWDMWPWPVIKYRPHQIMVRMILLVLKCMNVQERMILKLLEILQILKRKMGMSHSCSWIRPRNLKISEPKRAIDICQMSIYSNCILLRKARLCISFCQPHHSDSAGCLWFTWVTAYCPQLNFLCKEAYCWPEHWDPCKGWELWWFFFELLVLSRVAVRRWNAGLQLPEPQPTNPSKSIF